MNAINKTIFLGVNIFTSIAIIIHLRTNYLFETIDGYGPLYIYLVPFYLILEVYGMCPIFADINERRIHNQNKWKAYIFYTGPIGAIHYYMKYGRKKLP